MFQIHLIRLPSIKLTVKKGNNLKKICCAMAGMLFFCFVCPATAEQLATKPKGNFSKTLKRGERPDRDRDQQPYRIIESLGIDAGQNVCDIGAGTGYFSFKLANVVGDEGKVYAVDIDEHAITYIKDKIIRLGAKNIIPIRSEETDPKLPPLSCDKILIVNTYYAFQAPVTIMKHTRKALKPNGEVAIIGVKKDAEERGPDLILSQHRVSQEEVIPQMKEAGYRFIRSFDFLKNQYFLVFKQIETE